MFKASEPRHAPVFRPLETDDLDAVHELLSDWRVVRYMLLPLCRTKEKSAECLREIRGDVAGAPWISVARAIVAADSGAVSGMCGIEILRGAEQGELWYLVRPSDWGRGFATAAARELLRIGFAEMKLHRLFATCLPANPASARVLEKAGMRREALLRRNLKIHEVWEDSYLYAILHEEWLAHAQTP